MVLVRSRLRSEDTAGLFQATKIDNASTWTGFDGQRHGFDVTAQIDLEKTRETDTREAHFSELCDLRLPLQLSKYILQIVRIIECAMPRSRVSDGA